MMNKKQEKKILRSRSIYTGMGEGPLDGFIVTDGKRIAAVEREEALTGYNLAEYSFMDYGDCTVMPAFHDAHIHLALGAIIEAGGFLRNAASEEEAAATLRDLYVGKESEKWVLGGAWDHFKWPGNKLPSKGSLDKYFPDRPVYLINKECHGAWVNSKTLEYFGITKDTKDPEFGKFYRDEHGEPTGYLLESASVDVLKKILAEIPKDVLCQYSSVFCKKAHSLGITSVSDMQISGITMYDVYDIMSQKGDLDVRVHFTVPILYPADKMLSLREKYTGEYLRFSGVKDFVDGTPMGYTGLMIEPYCDMPDSRGYPPAMDIDLLREKVIEMDSRGIRVRLHACGDMAVRICLDCFEAARRKNGDNGCRHTIEHIEACSPDDIPRFAELGVIASVQPDHMPKYDFANHPFHKILGAERMRYSWPFGSLLKSGAMLGFGTDYPVSELNPMRGLFRAVTRLTDEYEPKNGFNPQERLALSEALRATTFGAAYINGRESDMGTLVPGKYADIAVLSENIFDSAPTRIKEIEIIGTLMDGNFVYEK